MSLPFVIVLLASAASEPECANCNGDYNASFTECPIACPSTCARPNAQYCDRQCGTPGCACNPGYLLTEIDGICIKPEDCPCGKVCGPNEVFENCRVKCPNTYCPVDDLSGVACDPGMFCPSGCNCKSNYLRRSVKDDTCIPVLACPPVNCTRPNEEWNRCVDSFYSDFCQDRYRDNSTSRAGSEPDYCRPRCVCKKGFYRNQYNTCITEQLCPGMG